MTSISELFRITLALAASKIFPAKMRTRICRLIYNYNSRANVGLDCVIDYQPIKVIPKLKLLVNTKEFISWNIFFLHHYELDTDLILSRFVKKEMHVVEAGAQIGSETVLLGALVGATGRIYAFEPNPMILKRLRLNIEINDFSGHIVSSGIALGDTNQDISFYIDNEMEPNQGRSSKYNYDARTVEITARQQKLDDWTQENHVSRVDFIKMDVQGAEIDILNGAFETITRFKPIIFTEASASMQGNAKYSMDEMYRMLASFGYSVYLVAPGGKLQPISETTLVGGNWLALFKV